jgi:CRISPR-associated protein Cmr4
MGVAREVHTGFPHLPASSARGKIRSHVESQLQDTEQATAAADFFGRKIEGSQQPTEGHVWFSDASLLFFPVASADTHLIWITCPLWLERWQRWYPHTQETEKLGNLLPDWTKRLQEKEAIASFHTNQLFLQTAIASNISILTTEEIEALQPIFQTLQATSNLLQNLPKKLVILDEDDCLSLVETGLQREVRVALEANSKTVKGGSFRSEEAIPPETILFLPWGVKSIQNQDNHAINDFLHQVMASRLQFGGLESLGRGWANLTTVDSTQEQPS